ncbi:MAG: M15 family metallopeptidase [Clostridiaceae bacterium]
MLLHIFLSSNLTAKAIDKTCYDTNMKRDILVLMMSYPEYVIDVNKGDNGNVYIIMKSGKKILYDDKIEKSFEQKLANPDLQDTLEQIYPLNSVNDLMEKNFDPGRFRNYELLTEVYGSSRKQVEKNLVNVTAGGSFQFNKNNKASDSLKRAMKELQVLAGQNKKIAGCIYPCSGTYNYRTIAGTNRLSPHSFGNTIDLARDKRDYWKWATEDQGKQRLQSYPNEIPEAFEKNNFIWGGKWNHFDILHYEYRPEIILKSRYFGNCNNTKLWYEGVPLDDNKIRGYIEKIEKI